MLPNLRRISKLIFHFSKYVILINSIFIYLFKYLFTGHENAINYLCYCNKVGIIPILKLFGASIGKNCDIQTGITFQNCYNFKNLTIGDNCHIGKNCFLDLREKVIIKNNVVVSMQCTFLTHIDMSKSNLSSKYPAKALSITIENNVYIGAKSIILMGVTVGECSLIGANSMLNKSIKKNTIAFGYPAKEINTI
jgi:acetyltransferase-like isoleucine patch superfamily enzyme